MPGTDVGSVAQADPRQLGDDAGRSHAGGHRGQIGQGIRQERRGRQGHEQAGHDRPGVAADDAQNAASDNHQRGGHQRQTHGAAVCSSG